MTCFPQKDESNATHMKEFTALGAL
jgi:hypothetical protein